MCENSVVEDVTMAEGSEFLIGSDAELLPGPLPIYDSRTLTTAEELERELQRYHDAILPFVTQYYLRGGAGASYFSRVFLARSATPRILIALQPEGLELRRNKRNVFDSILFDQDAQNERLGFIYGAGIQGQYANVRQPSDSANVERDTASRVFNAAGGPADDVEDDDPVFTTHAVDPNAVVRRVEKWIAEDNLPPGARFGARFYRNSGSGWRLLAGRGGEGDYPADGIATRNGDTYSLSDHNPNGTLRTPAGLAADISGILGELDPPPPHAKNFARSANGFWVCSAGREMLASLAGNPSAWPPAHRLTFPEDIERIVEFADRFLVICTTKVFEVSGTVPGSLRARDLELVYYPTAAAARVGGNVLYFCDEGVAAYGGGGTQLATANVATRRDFAYLGDDVFAASTDGRFFVFGARGRNFCFSPRDGGALTNLLFYERRVDLDELDAPGIIITAAAAGTDGRMVMCANDGGGRNIGFLWDPVPGDDVERQACKYHVAAVSDIPTRVVPRRKGSD